MAGGSGTRLWPASSSRLPKQFLSASASAKKSFFSMALERALLIGERVIVISGKSHVPHVVRDASAFSPADKKRIIVIGEPSAKNTAPAAACAAAFSLFGGSKSSTKKEKTMLVLTSDHIIKPLNVFKSDALLAKKAALDGQLVVFGIPPARPETGYGYIETSDGKGPVFKVAAFHEKPDLETAKKYGASSKFFWNSGMFAFGAEFIKEQFNKHAPDVYEPFDKLKEPKKADYSTSKGIKVLTGWKGLASAYNKTKSISFDYAIAEKCTETSMVRTSFDWIDIGNWEEYIKIYDNTASEVFRADSNTCFVDSDIPVALAGVDDLIVVIRSGKDGSPASALITRKGQTQKVRDITDNIKAAGRGELL